MEELHRVFVGGLFDSITKDELKNRFLTFGDVTDVTIVHKKDGEGNTTKTFGYVNLMTTTPKLNKCFALFGGTKWKGQELKVQLAKEDFMARLEKERNEPPEVKKKKKKNIPIKTYSDILETTSTMRRIVPGTPVEGERNWVIGKYGRPLPIVYVPKLGSRKTIKVDPSKFCHCLRRIPDKEDDIIQMDTLTWSLDDNDVKIKKKKVKRVYNEDNKELKENENVSEESESKPVKKKKKKRDTENALSELNTIDKELDKQTKKKKKKHDRETDECDATIDSNINTIDSVEETPKIEDTDGVKRKKRRKKDTTEEIETIEPIIGISSIDTNTNTIIDTQVDIKETEKNISRHEYDDMNESTVVNISSDEVIIPDTLFEDIGEEENHSDIGDEVGNKLGTSIVEQLLAKKISQSDACNESNGKPSCSIIGQLSSLKKPQSLNVENDKVQNKTDENVENEEDTDSEQENLFNFEFGDIAGEDKKSFLQTLINNIEVRDEDVASDSAESSEEEDDSDKSSCEESENDKVQNKTDENVENEEDTDSEQENLFNFEFKNIAGEDKKSFLQTLMNKIEVRDDDVASDSAESSEEEDDSDKSSCEESENDKVQNMTDENVEIEDGDSEKENLFNFEFKNIAGEDKKSFLQTLINKIEVRDDVASDSAESSEEEDDSDKSSCEESEGDVEPLNKLSETSNVTCKTENKDSIPTNEKDTKSNDALNDEFRITQECNKNTTSEVKKDIKKSKIQNSNKQEKHALSEEKRQKSLEARNSQVLQNKGLVSKALKDVDKTTVPANRIVFSDNDSDDDDQSPVVVDSKINDTVNEDVLDNNAEKEIDSNNTKPEKSGTKQLFDDSDEETDESDSEQVIVKPQFQGKEGEKLFKLQQKFGGDERFKFDERFAEDEQDTENQENEGEGQALDEENTQKEKETNISILEQVLGKTLTGEKKEREYVHQRYDPDNIEHEKFEIKETLSENKEDGDGLPKSKKKQPPVIELPEVSTETFYDVNESIKDLFGKGESVSFSFFGSETTDDVENEVVEVDNSSLETSENLQLEYTEEDQMEVDDVHTIKEPSWKKGLEELNQPKEKIGEIIDVVGGNEIYSTKQTFLLIPKGDKRLEAAKRFIRTEELEEVTIQWKSLRRTLTEDYKKKHKDAVRRVRKMREKRFNKTS